MSKVVINVKKQSPVKLSVTITNDLDNVTGGLYQWLTTNNIRFTERTHDTEGSPSTRLMTSFNITHSDSTIVDELIKAAKACGGVVYCIDNTYNKQFSVLVTPNGEHVGFSW